MNTESLKAVTRSRWAFVLGIWRHRSDIRRLCEASEGYDGNVNSLRDTIHKSKLEIDDLRERLDRERVAHAKTRGHVEFLSRFIALRHRVNIPAPAKSIRKILQEAEIP